MDTEFDDDRTNSKIIYKLGKIEAQVTALSDSIINAVHRLEDKISDTNRITTAEIAALKVRVDENERRHDVLENWKNTTVARITGITSAVSIVWLLLGDNLKKAFDGLGHIF